MMGIMRKDAVALARAIQCKDKECNKNDVDDRFSGMINRDNMIDS